VQSKRLNLDIISALSLLSLMEAGEIDPGEKVREVVEDEAPKLEPPPSPRNRKERRLAAALARRSR
jgi:hypothetical protein